MRSVHCTLWPRHAHNHLQSGTARSSRRQCPPPPPCTYWSCPSRWESLCTSENPADAGRSRSAPCSSTMSPSRPLDAPRSGRPAASLGCAQLSCCHCDVRAQHVDVRVVAVFEQHPCLPDHRLQSPNDHLRHLHRGAHARALRRALVHVHDVRKVLRFLHHQAQFEAWQVRHVVLQKGTKMVIRKLPPSVAQGQSSPSTPDATGRHRMCIIRGAAETHLRTCPRNSILVEGLMAQSKLWLLQTCTWRITDEALLLLKCVAGSGS